MVLCEDRARRAPAVVYGDLMFQICCGMGLGGLSGSLGGSSGSGRKNRAHIAGVLIVLGILVYRVCGEQSLGL